MSKEMVMDKIIKEEVILSRCKGASHFIDNRWRWKDIKNALDEEGIILEDGDILQVGYTEGWNESDSARDNMYDLIVIRPREETETEFEKRIKRVKENEKFLKGRRYEAYLKLKEEFDIRN